MEDGIVIFFQEPLVGGLVAVKGVVDKLSVLPPGIEFRSGELRRWGSKGWMMAVPRLMFGCLLVSLRHSTFRDLQSSANIRKNRARGKEAI